MTVAMISCRLILMKNPWVEYLSIQDLLKNRIVDNNNGHSLETGIFLDRARRLFSLPSHLRLPARR